MIEPEPYCALEAFIEQDQTDWMGDGVLCQLVTVMMSDLCRYRDYADIVVAACLDALRHLGFRVMAPAGLSA